MIPTNPTYKQLFSSCSPTEKYSRLDGSCNNLEKPHFGMARTMFKRFFKPVYGGDGRSSLRESVLSSSGRSLPSEIVLSDTYCRDNSAEDPRWTVFMPAIGQFITHDITSLAPTQG
jgi:hypothetical protein